MKVARLKDLSYDSANQVLFAQRLVNINECGLVFISEEQYSRLTPRQQGSFMDINPEDKVLDVVTKQLQDTSHITTQLH